MKLHAAIFEGPKGQFAVLRAQADAGEPPITESQRRSIAACFKSRHDDIPIAFVANDLAGLQLIGYEDATDDFQQCVRDLLPGELERGPWQEVDAGMMA